MRIGTAPWPTCGDGQAAGRAEDPAEPDTLDAHPLVREHFGEQLRRGGPGRVAGGARPAVRALQIRGEGIPRHDRGDGPALRGGGARLPGRPAPGGAGRGVLAADSERGKEHYSCKKLGAFGADLAALSGFFDPPWRRPVDGLKEVWRSWVLSEAGSDLRALGRLAEAVEPMQAGVGGSHCRTSTGRTPPHRPATSASCPWRPATWPGPSATLSRASSWPIAAATPSRGCLTERPWPTRCTRRATSRRRTRPSARPRRCRRSDQPEFPLLYSLQGYQYCDLLLGRGQYAEVQRRASQTLEWARQYLEPPRHRPRSPLPGAGVPRPGGHGLR